MLEPKQKRILLIGGHELGCLCLEHLVKNKYQVVLCIVRKDDDGKDNIFPSLLKLAKRHKIKSIKPQDINEPDILKKVEAAKTDIVFSIHNSAVFYDKWLSLFEKKLGIVNAHHGPLPRYGGFWPEMWAIWNEEKDFGVTLHYVDRGVDSGNIIGQYPVSISNTDTRKTLYEKCTQTTFQLFKDKLDILLAGKIKGQKQDASKRTYYKRELPNGGFVDFNWTQEKIKRFYRAVSFHPFVGPKIQIGDRIISSVDADLPFFKPAMIQSLEYQTSFKQRRDS